MGERRQKRKGWALVQPFVPLAVLWLIGLCFLLGLSVQSRVPYQDLMLDPNHLADVAWYFGLVSNLGILAWTVAVTAGFFGAWIAVYGNRHSAAQMLASGALLSTLLLLDDLFQLHIIVRPLLGIPKVAAYGFYLFAVIWWLASQRREIRRTRIILLLAAGAALSFSVVADQHQRLIDGLDPDLILMAEDGAKFLGVLAWAQYFTLTSTDITRSIITELRSRARLEPTRSELDAPGHDQEHLEPEPEPAFR